MKGDLFLDLDHYVAMRKRILKNDWISLWNADIEYLLKYTVGAKLAIDLGTNTGASAIVMAQNADQVITIDLFEDTPDREDTLYPVIAKDIIEELSQYDNIMVIQCDTHDFQFQNFKIDQVDTIFIDADHTYDSVKKDFEHWFPKIKIGGYILLHDIDKPEYGVQRFIEKDIKNYPVQLVESGKAMGIYRKCS